MAFGSRSQLDYMLRHAGGASVTLGDESTYGTFEYITVEESDGEIQIQTKQPSLLLRRGALTDLARGVTLTIVEAEQEIDADYQVREISREDDGLMLRVILVET